MWIWKKYIPPSALRRRHFLWPNIIMLYKFRGWRMRVFQKTPPIIKCSKENVPKVKTFNEIEWARVTTKLYTLRAVKNYIEK